MIAIHRLAEIGRQRNCRWNWALQLACVALSASSGKHLLGSTSCLRWMAKISLCTLYHTTPYFQCLCCISSKLPELWIQPHQLHIDAYPEPLSSSLQS